MSEFSPKVIYEDNHLLVVEKPVNIPSQADQSGDPDLLSILKNDLKRRFGKPGNVYLGLVHRLDRPVGGVMVFARTSKAAARLAAQIREGRIEKTYLAVILGSPVNPQGTLRHSLVKDGRTNKVYAVSKLQPGSKEAILDYQVIGERAGLSLVRINLHTGRSHQIRIQFATIGHPLYGDQKYGRGAKPGEQIALWANAIRFFHPTKNEELCFSTLPPKELPWNLFPILESVQNPFKERIVQVPKGPVFVP
ncbi:MAG: RluA family pseudouridine synthase [Bacillota bacterium]